MFDAELHLREFLVVESSYCCPLPVRSNSATTWFNLHHKHNKIYCFYFSKRYSSENTPHHGCKTQI